MFRFEKAAGGIAPGSKEELEELAKFREGRIKAAQGRDIAIPEGYGLGPVAAKGAGETALHGALDEIIDIKTQTAELPPVQDPAKASQASQHKA